MWTHAPFDPVIEGDWLYGRGGADMKVGHAANIFAMDALRRIGLQPAATVYVQSVVEEESTGNGALMTHLRGYTADAALIPEPEEEKLVRANVGVVWFQVEVKGHPAMDWIGTGWLVAPDVVITNRHVAKEFSRQSGRSWVFEPGMKGRIDFHEEFGGGPALEFSLTEVIGVHDDHDMALFRATKRSGGKALPPPLKLAPTSSKPRKGREVYVVGYPASDSRRNDPDEMRRIFDNIYNVKRLQPGELKRVSGSRPASESNAWCARTNRSRSLLP